MTEEIEGAPAYLSGLSLDALERIAAELLAHDSYAYFSTGSRDEVTLRANRSAWGAHLVQPRVLRGRTVDLRTTVLGQQLSMPVLVAPMAAQGLAHPMGELATARAVSEAGAGMVLSTTSHREIEEIAAVPGAVTWFQLYAAKDDDVTLAMIERARAAGATAIVLTVDNVLGETTHRRPHDWARVHRLPYPMIPKERYEAPDLDWAAVARLGEAAGLPIIPKGIMHPDDARRAVDAGCAALVVSNHGGRQLDGALPTALALPDVAAAVGDRCEVYVDGGIRRGVDVLRALALGARAVMIGRPILWGLTIGGQAGVARVLELLRTELRQDAIQAGVVDLGSIPSDLLRFIPSAFDPGRPGD